MNRILAFALIFVASVLVTYWFFMRPEPDLPIYQPSDINPALVDASVRAKEDHRVMDFRLVNHLGDTVTLADVEGQILVADFFFTRCATICPLMTKNLKRIHDRLPADAPVQLLSHSVTPEADSVSVLKAYSHWSGSANARKNHSCVLIFFWLLRFSRRVSRPPVLAFLLEMTNVSRKWPVFGSCH